MRFGLVGRSLPHSFSKELHALIAPYPYEITEVAEEDFDAFMRAHDFSGINVTIPYKEKVIPYLSYISPFARACGAVNVVMNHGGKLYGYNTDYRGLRALLRKMKVDPAGKKVMILGSGGAAKTARALMTARGAREILIVSSSGAPGAISYEEALEKHADAGILLNATPVGTFPGIFDSPVPADAFAHPEAAVDLVYNPLRTEFVLSFRERGVKAEGGLYMLVSQALGAAEIFTGGPFPASRADEICDRILRARGNIVLVGMPTVGKTTVGRILSEKTGKTFIDIDESIEKKCGKSPARIIREEGESAFRALERQTVRDLAGQTGAVVSTGGGTVLDPANVRDLQRNGRIVFLDRPAAQLIPSDDRPLSATAEDLQELEKRRRPLYLEAADLTVDAAGAPAECAERVLKLLYETTGKKPPRRLLP